MKKKVLAATLLFLLLFGGVPKFLDTAPRARAMDPVTIAILAPLALKAASIAMPYVMRGIQCTGNQFIKIGVDIADFLRLPIGFFQMTLAAPLGQFDSGLSNCCKGLLAPFKLAWDVLLLPIAFSGVSPP